MVKAHMDFRSFSYSPLISIALVLGVGCTTDPDPDATTDNADATGPGGADTGDDTGNGPGNGPGDDTEDTNDTVDPDTGEPTPEPPGIAGECPVGERVGVFDVILEAEYSAINGEVRADLVQTTIITENAAEGECVMRTVANPFCDPPCGGGEVCTNAKTCEIFPERITVGTVNISGMEVPVAMEPAADSRYFETNLPHPAIAAGAALELTADGITMEGLGFGALSGVTPELYVAEGNNVDLTWEPEDGEAWVRIELNIDQHGISPATLFCDVPDTGSYSIPAALVDALMASGVSGFPSANIYRQTVDWTNGPTGCVEFRVRARTPTDVEIEGHTACNGDMDCPDGQTCNIVIQTCQ